MGRMLIWVAIAVLIVLGAIWLSSRAAYGPQSRIEAPVVAGNAS